MKRPAHRAGRFVCFTNLSFAAGLSRLSDGEVFLMNSQSADSLDGRYFRVLPTATITGKVVSLWTGWEDDVAAPEQPFVQVVWLTKLEEAPFQDYRNHSDPPVR
jgi:hypothetical protein